MQYRLVPQLIQQPGAQAVMQLQAHPHQLQQNNSGQTVIAVQPAHSQQDGQQQQQQQQTSEVNYSQVRLNRNYAKILVRRVISDRYRITQEKFQYHWLEI